MHIHKHSTGGIALLSMLCSGCVSSDLQGTIVDQILVGPHSGAPYEVNLYLPPGHESDATGLPLVLVLDGDMAFRSVAQLAEDTASTGDAQAAVLLGVGNADWRGLDLTPSVVAYEPSGGVADYFEWIENELVAEVESTYGCGGSAEQRIVTGHSYGGLATTWAMLERNEFWGGFGASSASLWWDSQHIFALDEAYANRHSTLPARTYFSMGAIEVAPMNIDFNNFTDRLDQRNYEGFSLESEVLYGHEHYSSFDPAFIRTLQILIPEGGA